jgi:hypothetical protein
MKKILLLLLMVQSCTLFAAFDDAGFGTRGLALGPGFVALADDVSALYYNPAGLSGLKKNEVFLSGSKLYLGLGSDNPADTENNLYSLSAGYARDLDFLHAAVGFYRLALGSYYAENIFILAAGKEFKKINLKAGLSLKVLNNAYGSDIYTSANSIFDSGNSSTGFGLDLGVIYTFRDFSLGLSAVNLYTTALGIQSKDMLPIRIVAGLAWIMPATMKIPGIHDLIPVIGIQSEDNDFVFSIGSEIWFFSQKQLGIRFNFSAGNNSYSAVGVGVSYDKSISDSSDIRFNYGFDYPLAGIKGTYGTHHLDVSFSF